MCVLHAALICAVLACFAGWGQVSVDDEGRTGTAIRVEENVQRTIRAAEAQQVQDARELGCAKAASAKDATGFAVHNVIDRKRMTSAAYVGARHGVDNLDGLSVYRVSWDEGWALAKAGKVAVIAGC
jgi:hypothetical protein